MRLGILISILLFQLQAYANMANPVLEGTLSGEPFVSQYVDVVHEDINITIDENFHLAHYEIVYHINSSKDGSQIPFLFYASEYRDAFTIKIDGIEVVLNDVLNDFNVHEDSRFRDFSYFFEQSDSNELSEVLVEEYNGGGFYVTLNNMICFETNISKGPHTIEVSYNGTRWTDGWDWINEYSFRYALSPAKYWKSFGTLDVQIDARNFTNPLSANIGAPDEGSIDSIGVWHFDYLPADILQIDFIPQVGFWTKKMIDVGPMGLAYCSGLILVIIHLFFIIRYRKKYPLKKYSIVLFVGAFLIPLIFVISWMYYPDLLDYMIGEHASENHGYIVFVAVFYPVIVPFYTLFCWLVDRFTKKKIKTD